MSLLVPGRLFLMLGPTIVPLLQNTGAKSEAARSLGADDISMYLIRGKVRQHPIYRFIA